MSYFDNGCDYGDGDNVMRRTILRRTHPGFVIAFLAITFVLPAVAVGYTCDSFGFSWVSSKRIIHVSFHLIIIPVTGVIISWRARISFWTGVRHYLSLVPREI